MNWETKRSDFALFQSKNSHRGNSFSNVLEGFFAMETIKAPSYFKPYFTILFFEFLVKIFRFFTIYKYYVQSGESMSVERKISLYFQRLHRTYKKSTMQARNFRNFHFPINPHFFEIFSHTKRGEMHRDRRIWLHFDGRKHLIWTEKS